MQLDPPKPQSPAKARRAPSAPKSTEFLPTYFRSGRPTGHAFPRRRVHQLGLWHRTISCWIVRAGGGRHPSLVLQERHPDQDAWPGRLDTTSAGHLVLGETDPLREIEEELGVRPDPAELTFLGVRRYDGVSAPGQIDRELQETYLWINDLPLDAYRLQPDEVTALVEIALPVVRELWLIESAPAEAIRRPSKGRAKSVRVTLEAFVPETDRASLKVANAAQTILEGRRPALPLREWGLDPILPLSRRR